MNENNEKIINNEHEISKLIKCKYKLYYNIKDSINNFADSLFL